MGEVIGNSIQLFRLIKETGIKNPAVSETISEKGRAIIRPQSRKRPIANI